VFVPEPLIFYPQGGEVMDPIQARGFVWFELLISASYLGAATNLAERAIARGRGSDEDRAGLTSAVGLPPVQGLTSADTVSQYGNHGWRPDANVQVRTGDHDRHHHPAARSSYGSVFREPGASSARAAFIASSMTRLRDS
jgi:hypothetical protein